jgi:glyoxylase-like metal-dependent hydrolase (beta-lactamase superfamily II)
MPEGSHRFSVGTIQCTVLTDGYASYPTPWVFPNAGAEKLERALESRRLPQGTVISPYTCLLIESGRETVLVDTGAGSGSPTSGAIRARLEMAGLRPRDVDTVVLTHGHPDHIGGTVGLCGRPAFPNARYMLAEAELEFWLRPRCGLGDLRLPEDLKRTMDKTARSCLAALRFQLEPIDRECEVVPGVRAIPAPGHTPGHLALLIESQGERLLNIGDAAVHPLHLAQPEWENGFDLAAGAALRTRRELMDRAVRERMHVMAFHFPFPSVGRVAARAEGGWSWTPGW